jgi:RNA polymerase sigma factor (sigma-70 family)
VAAAAAGDAAACERLVEAFLPSIAGVARIYRGTPGLDRDELIQEGVVGLLRAARRYDAARGTPFWAYASWWVRQAMQQLVAELARPVALSDRPLRALARIREARAKHLQDHGKEPSIAALTSATGLPRKQIESLIAIERTPRGLHEPLSTEEGTNSTMEDFVADPVAEDHYEHVLDRMEVEYVRDLTEGLGERERNVLYSHYGLGRPAQTLAQIAGPLGVSTERVRQIEAQALEKLRMAAASGIPLSGP